MPVRIGALCVAILLPLLGCSSTKEEKVLGDPAEGKTRPVTWSWPDAGRNGPLLEVEPGDNLTITLRAAVADGVRLYTDKDYSSLEFAPVPTTLSIAAGRTVSAIGAMQTDAGNMVVKTDPHFGDRDIEYWVGTVDIDVPITIADDAEVGTTQFGTLTVEYMACTDRVCYPAQKANLPIRFEVSD